MIRSKVCFKCHKTKPLKDFYRHKQMADGHLNKCKDCTKKDASAHRNANLEKIRAYDRERARNPVRAAAASEISARWRREDARRIAAHNAVTRALRKGTLVKQPCVRCGSQHSLGHHEDYDRKLDVTWLCQPCHKERHKELRALELHP